MAIAPYESSDSNRHARPLKFARQAVFDEPLLLERGGRLPQISVTYETYGRLNADKTNAVLICHALSGDSHVARHQADDDPGWWDIVVGAARPIDTDRYFVICPNVLGGCRGTTGPNSLNPQSGKPYGADFPVITVGDIVEVQRRLVDHLGIDRLLAVVGGSLGGHMVLHWATRHPDRLAGAVPIATSACLTSQALAFDVVGRNAILRDPDFQAGQYYGTGRAPLVGLAIARMLGHITYLSREGMMEKFDAQRFKPRLVRSEFETKFSSARTCCTRETASASVSTPTATWALSMAMDLFDLGYSRERLAAAIRAAPLRWLLMSFTSDWLFPPFQSQEVVDALVAAGQLVSYCNIQSRCGHDAFLLPDELPVYGELIRAFLANLGGRLIYTVPAARPADAETAAHSPTSIFHSRHRLDYDKIMELIPPWPACSIWVVDGQAAGEVRLGAGTGGWWASSGTNSRSSTACGAASTSSRPTSTRGWRLFKTASSTSSSSPDGCKR